MLKPRIQAGVSLIEIMIGLSLIAILSVMVVPGYGHWIANTRIRNATEGIHNGMQIARAEAVRRNSVVQVVIGTDSGWVVSLPATGELVQSRPAVDGAQNVAVTFTPAAATTLSFNGMGWITANDDASVSITRLDATKTGTVGPEVRPLRLVVGTGGATKMCDPAVAAGDPRACP